MIQGANLIEQWGARCAYLRADESPSLAGDIRVAQFPQRDDDFGLTPLDLQVRQEPNAEPNSLARSDVPRHDGLVFDGACRSWFRQLASECVTEPRHQGGIAVCHDHAAVDGLSSSYGAGRLASSDSAFPVNQRCHVDQVTLIIGDRDTGRFAFPLTRQATEAAESDVQGSRGDSIFCPTRFALGIRGLTRIKVRNTAPRGIAARRRAELTDSLRDPERRHRERHVALWTYPLDGLSRAPQVGAFARAELSVALLYTAGSRSEGGAALLADLGTLIGPERRHAGTGAKLSCSLGRVRRLHHRNRAALLAGHRDRIEPHRRVTSGGVTPEAVTSSARASSCLNFTTTHSEEDRCQRRMSLVVTPCRAMAAVS